VESEDCQGPMRGYVMSLVGTSYAVLRISYIAGIDEDSPWDMGVPWGFLGIATTQ